MGLGFKTLVNQDRKRRRLALQSRGIDVSEPWLEVLGHPSHRSLLGGVKTAVSMRCLGRPPLCREMGVRSWWLSRLLLWH